MKIIKIDDNNIAELTKIIENIRIRHLPIHYKIDELMQRVLNEQISYETYQEKYNIILNSCRKELKILKYKICLVYIYNLINKDYNEEEYTNFRNLISGMHNQLDNNVFDKRIIEYIMNFDIDAELEKNNIKDILVTKNNQLIENNIINISIKLFNQKTKHKKNKQIIKTK